MEICAPQRPSENSNNFPRKKDEHVHQHDSYRAPSQGQQFSSQQVCTPKTICFCNITNRCHGTSFI